MPTSKKKKKNQSLCFCENGLYRISQFKNQFSSVQTLCCLSSGLLLGKMGERGAPLVNVCQCINECVMKIINAAMW